MEELSRQKKVLSMMITMHSILRDRYKFKALVIDIILFSSAIILNALVFVDYTFFESFGLVRSTLQGLVGIFSICVFIISIIIILVNWKEKADKHETAVNQLSKLLNDCRHILLIEGAADRDQMEDNFNIRYKEINESIIKIPDKKFVALKSKHLKKVELSKLLEELPQYPLWILKLKLFFNTKH